MRVFVAGASGVVGQWLVPRLVGAGHVVTAMTRSAERAQALAARGATPVVGHRPPAARGHPSPARRRRGGRRAAVIADDVRRRRYPIVGDGGGVFSFLHVEDAAGATQAALERGPGGVYNVADDEPAALRSGCPYAAALGAPPRRRVPPLVARLAAGRSAAVMATRMTGADNAKAKGELGWAPRRPSWRSGLATRSPLKNGRCA